MGKINIIGTGPGSPDYVLPAARKIVQVTEVIIGAQRSLSLFKEEIKGKSVSLTAENLKEVLQYAYECAKKGQTVAILSTGDPGFSGLLKSFLNNITIQDVEVEVVPGISAIQVCAARLGMSWDDAGLLTFHDTVTASKKLALLEYAKAHRTLWFFRIKKKSLVEYIQLPFRKRLNKKYTRINL
jgi:cobalt-precorrin-7 (C5)-methyltransferase